MDRDKIVIERNCDAVVCLFTKDNNVYLNNEEEEIEIVNKIIVPYGCGEKYKNSPGWKDLAEFIEEAPKPKWSLAERIRFALHRIINNIRITLTKKTTTPYEDIEDWVDWED